VVLEEEGGGGANAEVRVGGLDDDDEGGDEVGNSLDGREVLFACVFFFFGFALRERTSRTSKRKKEEVRK
jgi:hypothetical protein